MSRKLISFLGNMRLEETTYCCGDQEHATCYMADAATRFFAPDRVFVVVTASAREKHFAELTRRMASRMLPEPVDIPDGAAEHELWTIFNQLAGVIDDGDQILFDITNSFRSLPMLALLVTSFVRVVRNVTLERIVYGAFEARDQATNRTPVFDLTPFARLLDWTTATDTFLRYGRADGLAELLNMMPATTQASTTGAQQLTASLRSLTSALHTSRPAEVMQRAASLDQVIQQFRDDAPHGEAAAFEPLALLLGRIEHEYRRFRHAHPHRRDQAREIVDRQLDVIEWYAAKSMYVQAFTLAREWLVSVVLAEVGADIYHREERLFAEAALGGFAAAKETGRDVPDSMKHIVHRGRLNSLWEEIRILRNDLAHAGMSRNARPASEVEARVARVCAQLRQALATARAHSGGSS